MRDERLIIVGGGISGLATACALARVGLASTVLEQAAQFAEIGAGVQFGPNALKMLQMIGCASDVEHLAIYPDSAVMLDAVTGEEVTRTPFGRPFVERFKFPYALIHRADLHGKLLEAAKRSSLVSLHTGIKVRTVSQNDRQVVVTAEDDREFTGQAVIGADGLWSVVRQVVVGDGKPRVSGHVSYRSVLPTAEMPPSLRTNVMTLWAGEKVHLVHYPLRGGTLYNLVATFESDRFAAGWNTFGDPEELRLRFASTNEQVRNLLEKINTWRMWVLCDREPIKNWSKDRITLVGDAAHPMLQYLGQGAAMSLEDAVCLAGEIAKASGNFALAAVQYQEKRYLRTARAQVMARLHGDVFHASGVVRELRNKLIGAAGRSYEATAWMYDYEI